MIIKPKVRGFICITTHPEGCAANIKEQIKYVKAQPPISAAPKNVLIIGSSTGYGLSSRIALAFGAKANTFGVYFERPPTDFKPASPGYYNTLATEHYAREAGLYADGFNGDAFCHNTKKKVIEILKESPMAPIDLIVYSLAAPKCVDPDTGDVFKSVLKTVGEPFISKSLDTDKKLITEVTIEPATEDEIEATIHVMGGSDWELWMSTLKEAGLLADGIKTVAYSYIGPEQTWPIYKEGTIGKAKQDLDKAAKKITSSLSSLNANAYVSVNKAIVTQASSAIPVVPLYISLLYRVMKEKGIHESAIEQCYRLFADRLYNNRDLQLDESGRIRIDDLEMRQDVQDAIKELWTKITSENLLKLSDFEGYREEFLKLFGFGFSGVDYNKEVTPEKLQNPVYCEHCNA